MVKMKRNECHLFCHRTYVISIIRFVVSLLLSLYEDKQFVSINVMRFFNCKTISQKL